MAFVVPLTSPSSSRKRHLPVAPIVTSIPMAKSAFLFATDGDFDRFDDETLPNIGRILKAVGYGGNPFVAKGKKALWALKEDDEAVYAKVYMPGVGKEGVKLWVDKDVLCIKGEETQMDPEFEFKEDTVATGNAKSCRKYRAEIGLPPDGECQTDKIKAVIKDGVLKVVVPKKNQDDEEGKEGVFYVTVN